MEEDREQPVTMPAPALNPADDDCAKSEAGSQNDILGKFKSVEALADAYNSLQSEFTKKCQQLSRIMQDKEEENVQPQNEEELLNSFLEQNGEAEGYIEEIKKRYSQEPSQIKNPYKAAWADILFEHLKSNDKLSDPILSQYILNDENVRNRVLTDYLQKLNDSKPPIVISSQSGERLSGVIPDSPKTLQEAKILVDKMFS